MKRHALKDMLDVGLLSAKSGLDVQTLLDGNRIFGEFKGALTEQYVQQQLPGRPGTPSRRKHGRPTSFFP